MGWHEAKWVVETKEPGSQSAFRLVHQFLKETLPKQPVIASQKAIPNKAPSKAILAKSCVSR